ncbi:MAG: UPF0102 protein [Patescibacteria group bacterium]|nr:MAG: UPF0102 protein [Patescibacteria group bacterium]
MKDLENLQLELKKKILTAQQKKLNNFSLGLRGETIACEYLQQHNFQILDRNSRVNNNEIDIIALDQVKNEIVFIEVKTRKSSLFGTPALAVSNKKLRSMVLVARNYLRQYHCNLDYRFDIIAICYLGNTQSKPQIEHFENISWP